MPAGSSASRRCCAGSTRNWGLVLPRAFISIAEERGLIVPIGDWVLREACRQNRAWQDAGLIAVPVGVNVSALQFRLQDFPDQVAAALRDSGLAPEYLELEITESVIMHGAENAIASLATRSRRWA